jgi:quercetin dioxygenase-like cupin family protein
MHGMVGRIARALTCVALAAALAVSGTGSALADNSTTRNGVTTTALAETAPENAPGQQLYLLEVRIAPGAKLDTHFHQGTRIASVRSGMLTFTIVSGTVNVTRAKGKTEQVGGPATIRLRPGDAITETESLVHLGANRGEKPVVVVVAQLLPQGAPTATTVNPSSQ